MAGYHPPTPPAAPTASSPLSGILDTILQLGGMVGGEALGGPVGAALGSGLGTGAGELISGQPLNAGSIGTGALYGLMPEMLGAKSAGAAADIATTAAQDAVANTASDLTSRAVHAAEGTPLPVVDTTTPTASTAPTIPTPKVPVIDANPGYEVGTHINLRQYPNGTISTTKVIPPEAPVVPVESPIATPTQPVVNPTTAPIVTPDPVPQTSPTDTFTQAPKPENTNLNPMQKVGNTITQDALKKQVQSGGSRLTQAEADQLAANLSADGYTNLGQAAQDAQHVTGNTGILSNGVNDHISNAEANGASINLGNYNDIAQGHINNTLMSGVLTPAQEKAAANTLNSVRNIVAGPQDVTDIGSLTHVLPSNNLKAVRALQDQAHAQSLIAQGRGVSAEGAGQLAKLYTNMGSDLLDRGFGVANGNAPISDANLNNMIGQVKTAAFNNPNYQQNLIDTLEAGKGGNMSLQDLRHLQANHVQYANAASPNEISNLTNGLMSAGLNKAGVTNAILNSDAGLTAKAKVGNIIKKLGTPSGESGTKTKHGGIMKTPIGKTVALAGILSALGIGGDAVLSSNQAGQASAMLNNPQYQATQNVLNQSNALQRYLGQMGEIRSIFAPTFDSNAAQAGSSGMALLNAANNNAAARMATNNLLAARSQMGQGGVLGNILAMIPGTAQNTYAKQAANAQAQLNALGLAGTAPSVAQSGNSIPALAGMAGNIGGF